MATDTLFRGARSISTASLPKSRTDTLPKGLNEEIIRAIWKKKEEPDYMLDFRLKAYRKWLEMAEPTWANVDYPPIDYQNICYYSAPKKKPTINSLDEVDPEVLKTFERLGIPLDEQKRLTNVAVDMVFDSVSIGTTFKKKLEDAGVVLCSISEAMQHYPELVKKYLGYRRADRRQLFCRLEFRCLYRWFFRLCSERSALPHGAFDLFPHQRQRNGPV